MRYEHEIVFGDVELIRIEGDLVYIVDREREELRSLDGTHPKFTLTQQQYGRCPDGEIEVLERYATEDESNSIVIDSSPAFLESLRDKLCDK